MLDSEGSGQSSGTAAKATTAAVSLRAIASAKVSEPGLVEPLAALYNDAEDSEDEVDVTGGAKSEAVARDHPLSPLKSGSGGALSSSSSSSNGSSGS